MHRLVFEQRRVAEVLVDWVGCHFGYVLRRLGLDEKSDESIRHQVVDRFEPLLPDEMLPIVKQPVVERLGSKPGGGFMDMIERKYLEFKPSCEKKLLALLFWMMMNPYLKAKVYVPGCLWLSLMRYAPSVPASKSSACSREIIP